MSLLFMLANLAFAQDAGTSNAAYLDSNLYRPPIESDGMLWTEDAGIAPDGLSNVGVHSTYIFDPLFYTGADENDDYAARSDALRLDVMGAAAIRGVQIGADIPVFMVNNGDPFYNGDAALGDVALDVKGGLIESGEDNPVNVGIGGRVILPTAAEDFATEVGVDAVAWEARLIADGEVADQLKLAANVGTRGLPDEIVDTDGFNNQFFFRTGAGYDVVEDAGVSLDVAGAFDYDRPVENQIAPVQGILGGYGKVADQLWVKGGLGSGLIPGAEGPQMRATLGVSWEPSQNVDEDLDTVGNNLDQCPGQAEDMDGFEDVDGCPDADNDRDNVADLVDSCADEAEDLDGIRDDDGCADTENKVSIRIRDEQGQLIETAKVSIQKDGQTVKSGNGNFDAELEPGMYELVAEDSEHATVRTSFRVYPEDTVQVSATMTPGHTQTFGPMKGTQDLGTTGTQPTSLEEDLTPKTHDQGGEMDFEDTRDERIEDPNADDSGFDQPMDEDVNDGNEY